MTLRTFRIFLFTASGESRILTIEAISRSLAIHAALALYPYGDITHVDTE